MLVSFRHGVKWGLFTGFVNGCLQMLLGFYAPPAPGLLPLVGMILLVPGIQRAFDLSSGACLLAAIIVLAIMILPSIISVSETALNAVPREYEEASLALGATELETYFRVSVPAAKSGIAAAVVLGVGRAIGETMAIIMVAGNTVSFPHLFGAVRPLTSGIAFEMGYATGLHKQALFGIGLVLFFLPDDHQCGVYLGFQERSG